MCLSRRSFLAAGAAAVLSAGNVQLHAAQPSPANPLAGEVGITMSSVSRLMRDGKPEKYPLSDWFRLLREEVDLQVIDLNTSLLDSYEPAYLDKVRAAADKAGCLMTNLKINRGDLFLGQTDVALRDKALAECRRGIEAAAHLGLKWARALPVKEMHDRALLVSAHQQLADFAAQRQVQLLVENYGWMDSDAQAPTQLVKDIGRNVAACPDTGNWSSEEVRYAGLASFFPLAVSCDFKAGKLGPQGEHKAWDLQRCFTIGWDAGFRGPWCLEHAHEDRRELFRELGLLRDMLKGWMKQRGAPGATG